MDDTNQIFYILIEVLYSPISILLKLYTLRLILKFVKEILFDDVRIRRSVQKRMYRKHVLESMNNKISEQSN